FGGKSARCRRDTNYVPSPAPVSRQYPPDASTMAFALGHQLHAPPLAQGSYDLVEYGLAHIPMPALVIDGNCGIGLKATDGSRRDARSSGQLLDADVGQRPRGGNLTTIEGGHGDRLLVPDGAL